MRRPWLRLLAGATVLAWLPLLGVLFASAVADWSGCRVDEAGIYPCLLAGSDWGPWLNTFFVLGWLMLLTAPFMLVSIVAWGIVLVAWWRRRRTSPP